MKCKICGKNTSLTSGGKERVTCSRKCLKKLMSQNAAKNGKNLSYLFTPNTHGVPVNKY